MDCDFILPINILSTGFLEIYIDTAEIKVDILATYRKDNRLLSENLPIHRRPSAGNFTKPTHLRETYPSAGK